MPARTLIAASALLVFGATGCRRHDTHAARALADQAVLKRQVEGLRELVALAEQGSLLPAGQFAIGVDQTLVRDLIAASLPQEQTVAGRFRVRVERAEATFSGNQSLVTLRGRVTSLEAAATFVDLLLRGGLSELTVDTRTGRLRGRVALDHFEVEQAAAEGAPGPLVSALIEELGRERLESFEALVPAFEIPVVLERSLAFKGFSSDGPVRVRPGELPVSVSVARVIPLSGRLWVLLEVAAGPWRSAPPAANPR